MTDIEVPMIWEFVSEGYSFSEAKKKAMQDVAKAFHFTEQDTLPAELSELSYDQQEYRTALYYFQRMLDVASSVKMRTTAMVGILRCSHHINVNFFRTSAFVI